MDHAICMFELNDVHIHPDMHTHLKIRVRVCPSVLRPSDHPT